MAHEAQLEWEARTGARAAMGAVVYGVLSVAGSVYSSAALSSNPDDSKELMTLLDSESDVFVTAAVIQGVALLALGPMLYFLYRVVKYRRPELPDVARVLALVGPVLVAIAGVLLAFDRIDSAEEYLASGARTEDRAEDLLRESGPLTLGVGLGGALALALAFVVIGTNAMRAGVLSRFMGILGVIVGVLYILGELLPVGGPGLLQLFWLVALAFLFLGRWPGGRGPAWETGEAIPWPSAAEVRAKAAEQAEQEHAATVGDPEADETPPAPRKRKRKKRR